jgi:hypothetical protein
VEVEPILVMNQAICAKVWILFQHLYLREVLRNFLIDYFDAAEMQDMRISWNTFCLFLLSDRIGGGTMHPFMNQDPPAGHDFPPMCPNVWQTRLALLTVS